MSVDVLGKLSSVAEILVENWWHRGFKLIK